MISGISIAPIVYTTVIFFIVIFEICRKKISSVNDESKKYRLATLITAIEIVAVISAIIICIWKDGLMLAIAIILYFFLLFVFSFKVSKLLFDNRIVYGVSCIILTQASVITRFVTGGSVTGFSYIIDRYNIVIYIFISTILFISLFMLRDKYIKVYMTKLTVNGIIALLMIGAVSSSTASKVCLMGIVILIVASFIIKEDEDYNPVNVKIIFQSIRVQFIKTFVVVLMVIVPYTILGPFEIYVGNIDEMAFSYLEFIPFFIVVGLVIGLTVALLVSAIPYNELNSLICGLIFMFGLLSYIQNMFLNTKLSEEDGGPLNMLELESWVKIDTIIWILVLLVASAVIIWKRRYINQIFLYGATALSLVQIIAVISLLITTPVSKGDDAYLFSGENELLFAKDENIIILVLDSFGNQCLDMALKKYPNLLDGLNDFTYYDNANCDYQGTYPSMIHMLTGYDVQHGTVSTKDYKHAAWTSEACEKFYREVHNAGYQFRVYSQDSEHYFGKYDDIYGKVDNIELCGSDINKKELYRLFLKMSTFKYMPYACKKPFETFTWEFTNATTVLGSEISTGWYWQMLKDYGLGVDETVEKAVTVKHLMGVHVVDGAVNGDIQYVENITVEDQVCGVMGMVNEYLDQLKSINKYDDATIIITADHGRGYRNGMKDVQVVYFIKNSHEEKESLDICHAPIDHNDFIPSILELVENKENISKEWGRTYWDYSEQEKRERTYAVHEPGGTYGAYTYTGNRDNLIELMENEEPIIIE